MTICDVLIVAAGRGSRFGAEMPKQYVPLAGKPLLRWTIEAFLGQAGVRAVHTVIAPERADAFAEAVGDLHVPPPIAGRETRQGSVHAGLEALVEDPPALVAIHDGARPLVPLSAFDAAVRALQDPAIAGAVVAVPMSDSLKQVREGAIEGSVPRTGLWRMQTPQVFRFADILGAHRLCAGAAGSDATALSDDAAVAERAGLRVVVVPGSVGNLKVTTQADMELAARLLARPRSALETRTGFGFDVHAFAAGSGVTLCGVTIAYERRLAGHSDADVAFHAITDALLGALAEGDIGQHFPPSEPRWKDANSSIFLQHAAELLRARGGRLVHVDVTIVCESPRIGPHREAMRARVAEICGIDAGRVSVKATTTEGLGFAGRGEGIAAQAVASIEVPAS